MVHFLGVSLRNSENLIFYFLSFEYEETEFTNFETPDELLTNFLKVIYISLLHLVNVILAYSGYASIIEDILGRYVHIRFVT
jgi:hypothetical protein